MAMKDGRGHNDDDKVTSRGCELLRQLPAQHKVLRRGLCEREGVGEEWRDAEGGMEGSAARNKERGDRRTSCRRIMDSPIT